MKRKHVVVQAGQPEFLALVAIGCLIATSAVSLISYIIDYSKRFKSVEVSSSYCLQTDTAIVNPGQGQSVQI